MLHGMHDFTTGVGIRLQGAQVMNAVYVLFGFEEVNNSICCVGSETLGSAFVNHN